LHDPGQSGSLGLPRLMQPSNGGQDFIPAALAAFGIEADEVELAVMGAAHEVFWAPILELLSLDTGAVAPEPTADLSKPPPVR
jgi:hypothetical protein